MEDDLFQKMEAQLELPIIMAKEMIKALGKEKAQEIIIKANIQKQSARHVMGKEHIPPEKRDLRV